MAGHQVWCLACRRVFGQTLLAGRRAHVCGQVDEADRQECLAMMPMAFFLPAVMSGLAAIPVHTALCRLH